MYNIMGVVLVEYETEKEKIIMDDKPEDTCITSIFVCKISKCYKQQCCYMCGFKNVCEFACTQHPEWCKHSGRKGVVE